MSVMNCGWILTTRPSSGTLYDGSFCGQDWREKISENFPYVAVNWREPQVLIGEAKWTDESPDHKEWRLFTERAQRVVQRLRAADPANKPKPEPKHWQSHPIVFSRRGATPALRAEEKKGDARVITFAEMVRDPERLPQKPIR